MRIVHKDEAEYSPSGSNYDDVDDEEKLISYNDDGKLERRGHQLNRKGP